MVTLSIKEKTLIEAACLLLWSRELVYHIHTPNFSITERLKLPLYLAYCRGVQTKMLTMGTGN